jgi:hypothetical protein
MILNTEITFSFTGSDKKLDYEFSKSSTNLLENISNEVQVVDTYYHNLFHLLKYCLRITLKVKKLNKKSFKAAI